MATIALCANKINQMPRLITGVKRTVIDYKAELSALKNKTLTIKKSICNLDTVIHSIQSSSQLQEQKSTSLDTFQQNSEQFIEDADRIDDKAADTVNQRKKDFYDQYHYLKPECEKNGWEKFTEGCKKAGAWCKEHWKLIVTVVLVVAAVVLLCTGVGGPFAVILLGACKGLIAGALAGGLMGGIMSRLAGGSFWEGFENGAFAGALSGALLGGIGGAGQLLGGAGKLGKTCMALEKWGKAVKIAGGLSLGMAGFDLFAWGAGLFSPSNPLTVFNEKLHSNVLYNAFQISVSALAVFSAGAYQGLKSTRPVCFIAGTMILTAAGYLAIEKIRKGDLVISTNEKTLETKKKSVVETYIRETMHLIHLTINKEVISTTPNHPFYVLGKGFTEAGEIQPGDQVINAAGEPFVVEEKRIEFVKEPVRVYNFQVEEFHTYHVGELGVWVHNADYAPEGVSGAKVTNSLEAQTSINKKLETYLLDKTHATGGSKAKWFDEALGFNQSNLNELSKQIVFDPNIAMQTAITEYGTKFNQIISIKGANGKVIDVTFAWIKNQDGIVRLVTAIPTKK